MVSPSLSNNSQIVTAAETICLTPDLDESVSDVTTQIANVAHIYDINLQTFSIVDKDNKVAPKLAEISKALNTVQAKILEYCEVAYE